jgi:hypothetical protein
MNTNDTFEPAEDTGEDVTGSGRYHPVEEPSADESDTEGHNFRVALPDDGTNETDTEGHSVRFGITDDTDDDTEGHNFRV